MKYNTIQFIIEEAGGIKMVQPKDTGYVIVDTANIFYQIFGENQRTVILLHGNGEDWRTFGKQIEPLSKHFKVITIDSRGHGASSFGREQLSIEIMAEDVIGVMNKLNISKAVLVGFSDGGNIAIQIAIRYPNRVDKLILAGANLNPTGIKLLAQFPVIIHYLVCVVASMFSKRAGKQRQILDLMVNQPNFVLEELKMLNMPTLVLAGENDVIKEDHTKLIAKSIPNSKLEILPNADHFIFSRDVSRVNIMVIAYIYED